jgi:two-component system NtrC family sensor kinase
MKLIPQTIRVQIMAAFSVCFIFMAVIIAINYNNSRRLSRSMQLFELAGELNSTILEMRRYEKNYFLFLQQFNYEENITYTNQLALTLKREQDILVKAMGLENYEHFVRDVGVYASLMARMRRTNCDQSDCTDLQGEIRGSGQNLLTLADQLVTAERRIIDGLLRQMIPLPLLSLLMLVVLLAFVIFFIGEKVIRPLARITRESDAVAQGAFQRITPIGESHNEIHHLVAAINGMVSELEKRQEQLIQSRKLASIGTFTAGIAHEINNPVNNISLILESLIEDGAGMDEQERGKLYQDAMDQADRTSDIVKNLLEFSRASHPRQEEVDLEELVDNTARLLSNELKLNGIKFTKQVRARLPRTRLDKGGLQQVLLNLFMNAIQAMDRGGELRVTVGPADNPDEARVEVIDNGPGIPPDYLNQIFDPFFTTKKEGVGTGLGLSVSYNIIKKNKGRLEVESQPGQGTRFSIFLPWTGPGEAGSSP